MDHITENTEDRRACWTPLQDAAGQIQYVEKSRRRMILFLWQTALKQEERENHYRLKDLRDTST